MPHTPTLFCLPNNWPAFKNTKKNNGLFSEGDMVRPLYVISGEMPR